MKKSGKKKSGTKKRQGTLLPGYSLMGSPNLPDDLIPVSQAAELRGIGRTGIHDLINRGRLQAYDVFGRKFVSRAEVVNFQKRKPGRKTEGESD